MEQWASRGHLLTEQINNSSLNLDQLSSLELVDLFNREDVQTLLAIARSRESLAMAIDLATTALAQGGRLFYVGAGTSGRLGVLDAAECPPTFCTPPELVQGIIAGGAGALVRSSEDLEDRAEDGADGDRTAPSYLFGCGSWNYGRRDDTICPGGVTSRPSTGGKNRVYCLCSGGTGRI
jgi:Predicted sugar phosphate isomerase